MFYRIERVTNKLIDAYFYVKRLASKVLSAKMAEAAFADKARAAMRRTADA
jgi:cob(I)alamin adenosyltransferase